MTNNELTELRTFCAKIREEIVRMVGRAGTGHPGGSLSAVEIMTVLFRRVMKYKPQSPDWVERDRFILSKGHAAPVLYAVLAYCGFFPRYILELFREFGSILQGHPDSHKTPGVEISTGSLGQGLSIAGGMALGVKQKGLSSQVYVLLGDGETQEGQVWEAAMAISHYKLSNLTAIIDSNGLQIDGPVEKVMNIQPIGAKFAAFGWDVVEINGHDLKAIEDSLRKTGNSEKPLAIIAKTVKGKGVSYMENRVEYHHAKALPPELVTKAVTELKEGER